MAELAGREPLQQRVASVILDAAAQVLARRADASMVEVAAEAGVARATVYRYFPTRQTLVDELVTRARDRAATRLDDARVSEVEARRGIDRAVRSLLELGPAYVVMVRERDAGRPGGFETAVAGRLREVIRGGQDAGWIRRDVSDAWLTESLLGLVLSVETGPTALGRDDTVAVISSLFLDGAGAAPGSGGELADADTSPPHIALGHEGERHG